MDADACPVKDEISLFAKKHHYSVCFVASYDHQPNNQPYGEWIFVDPGSDSADLYILNHIQRNDILITEDTGLASLALPKGVYVLSSRGSEYTEDTISISLELRHLAAKERKRGNYGRGPKSYTSEDRHNFLKSLCRLLSKNEGIRK